MNKKVFLSTIPLLIVSLSACEMLRGGGNYNNSFSRPDISYIAPDDNIKDIELNFKDYSNKVSYKESDSFYYDIEEELGIYDDRMIEREYQGISRTFNYSSEIRERNDATYFLEMMDSSTEIGSFDLSGRIFRRNNENHSKAVGSSENSIYENFDRMQYQMFGDRTIGLHNDTLDVEVFGDEEFIIDRLATDFLRECYWRVPRYGSEYFISHYIDDDTLTIIGHDEFSNSLTDIKLQITFNENTLYILSSYHREEQFSFNGFNYAARTDATKAKIEIQFKDVQFEKWPVDDLNINF